MDYQINEVTKEFVRYSEFLIKLQKIVSDTEKEIDADDPDWREREHISIYGQPSNTTWKSPCQKTAQKLTNPSPFKESISTIENAEQQYQRKIEEV
jgi:hypothetical protein